MSEEQSHPAQEAEAKSDAPRSNTLAEGGFVLACLLIGAGLAADDVARMYGALIGAILGLVMLGFWRWQQDARKKGCVLCGAIAAALVAVGLTMPISVATRDGGSVVNLSLMHQQTLMLAGAAVFGLAAMLLALIPAPQR